MIQRHPARLLRVSALFAALAAAAPGFAAGTSAGLIDLHGLDPAKLDHDYQSVAKALGNAPIDRTDRHAELLGLDSHSKLQTLAVVEDRDGSKHYRYQQLVDGIPVFGQHVIVSERADGSTQNLFGKLYQPSLAKAGRAVGNPHYNAAQALQIAKGHAFGNAIAQMHTQREHSQQMWYVDEATGNSRLSWVVDFFADSAAGGAPSRPYTIVDANTGEVITSWEGLTTAEIGTGPGGNQKTGQYEWGSGGRYGYLDVAQSGSTCTMNNTGVKSVNLNGGTSSTTAWSYTCPRNTTKAINGAYAPINDAHYFGGVITKMYPAYTGYNALNFQLVMRVHYSSNYENAFWDGSTMSFGDGASTFYPLVSADVAGHEVSHGFTEQHSGLTYSGQSGGMNESFSDMGGEATEYYWKGSNDFLVGPEVFKSSGALRYMNNPPQDGGSIDNAADYNSGLDVHYSSGVYNKAFYLLATTSGWNTPTAFKVFARANALYWGPSETFNNGACGVETAATDLGLSSADVASAFTAVGVTCPTGGGGGGGGGSTTGDLQNGTPVTGLSASTGSYVKYKMVVPSGASNLSFAISGGSGDADLYVKFGSEPTDSSYDCRPYKNGNAETCSFATPSAGTYYVNLKAYSSFSNVTLTGSYSTSTPNNPPTANFTFSTSDLTASFTDTSSDSDGSIASHSWAFGDGSTSTSANPSHTYAAAGTYTVSETVTDNDGASATKTASVTVTAPPPTSSELTNGVPVTGLSASTGNYVRYTMVVPAGASNLSFAISGGTGDADLYVRYGSQPTDSTYDCRPYKTGNSETCSFATPQAGTYYIAVKAYSSFSGVSLVGSYDTSGGGGGGGVQVYSNNTAYAIPDKSSVTSSITVSGRSGNAPSNAQVSVNITHTYRGDLKIDLIAPDGSTYNLKASSGSDSADNVVATYTTNLSSEALNGTWKLKVRDVYSGDTGTLNSWSIEF